MARIIDSSNKNLIGQKVKELRKEKKMSQQQLSDKLETLAIYICRGSISRIEDGSHGYRIIRIITGTCYPC